MNKLLAKSLAESLVNLDFVTKAAGVVSRLTISSKNGRDKSFPASTEVFTETGCNKDAKYTDLVPNSEDIGILYFEDKGARMINSNSRRETWKGELKLVCWLQIGEVCGTEHTYRDLNDIICTVKDAVGQNIEPQNGIYAGHIRVTEEYPDRPSPFDQYDYNEADTQYLTHPYAHFSLKIEWQIIGKCNCGNSSGLSLQIPENTGGLIVQADWNEENEAAPSYIRNKPSEDFLAKYIFSKTN